MGLFSSKPEPTVEEQLAARGLEGLTNDPASMKMAVEAINVMAGMNQFYAAGAFSHFGGVKMSTQDYLNFMMNWQEGIYKENMLIIRQLSQIKELLENISDAHKQSNT